MDRIAVLSSIRKYVIDNSFNNENITDETLIFREGFFDSMGFVGLISFLEERYHITTLDQDLLEENFESINAITSYLLGKMDK